MFPRYQCCLGRRRISFNSKRTHTVDSSPAKGVMTGKFSRINAHFCAQFSGNGSGFWAIWGGNGFLWLVCSNCFGTASAALRSAAGEGAASSCGVGGWPAACPACMEGGSSDGLGVLCLACIRSVWFCSGASFSKGRFCRGCSGASSLGGFYSRLNKIIPDKFVVVPMADKHNFL